VSSVLPPRLNWEKRDREEVHILGQFFGRIHFSFVISKFIIVQTQLLARLVECVFFFVVITVASRSVLVSPLPLFSVSANTAT